METVKNSVLEAIKENFGSANLSTYVHRALYAGEHSFPEDGGAHLTDLFTNSIKRSNGAYCDAPVNGFLLIYQKYYVAIVEGSEETLSRQIKEFVFESDENNLFGRSKILVVYHNIKEKQFAHSVCLYKVPPTLASALSNDKTLDFYEEILQTVLDKLERLVINVTGQLPTHIDEVVESKLDTLPEYAIVEFILSSEYSYDLRNYTYMHQILPDYQFSFEMCWPTPYDFTPGVNYERELADIFIDPLPKSVYDVEEENEEEEMEPEGGSEIEEEEG